MVIDCWYCGYKENKLDAKFCGRCGRQLVNVLIPGYIVNSLIGVGSCSIVYKGVNKLQVSAKPAKVIEPIDYRDKYLKERKFKAIKVIKPWLTVIQDKFIDIATRWGRLHHPNIVECEEYGTDPLCYTILEFVGGGNLRHRLMTGLELSESLRILAKVAEALEFAHHSIAGESDAYLLHLDVRPDNVLFSVGGEPKLTDFGGTGFLGEGISEGGLGSLLYKSPEQFSGKVNHKSDIYQFGCLAYEVLTGKPPYQAYDAYEIRSMQRQGTILPLSQINPDCPKEVDDIMMKCLANDADQRPEGLAEIAQTLYEIGADIEQKRCKVWFFGLNFEDTWAFLAHHFKHGNSRGPGGYWPLTKIRSPLHDYGFSARWCEKHVECLLDDGTIICVPKGVFKKIHTRRYKKNEIDERNIYIRLALSIYSYVIDFYILT